jgi:hypothetical protein
MRSQSTKGTNNRSLNVAPQPSTLKDAEEKVEISSSKSQSQELFLQTKGEILRAIEEYLLMHEARLTSGSPAVMQASLYSMDGFRLHYLYGAEGKERACKYKEKIHQITTLDDLLNTVVTDLENASNSYDKATTYQKAATFLSAGYEYVRAKMSQSSSPIFNQQQPIDLGNSEVLAKKIAVKLCSTLKIDQHDQDLYNKWKLIDPQSAEKYISHPLKSMVMMLKEYIKDKRPCNKFLQKN